MKISHYALSIVLVVSLFFAVGKINAQDGVFSQFYASPLHVNPALMGVYDGQMRFNANYRQQWSGGVFSEVPINQIHASFDYRYRIADGDYLSFGINALEDQTGADSKLKSTRGNLGISYMKQLGGDRYRTSDQYLVAGFQVGGGQNRLGTGGLWFDRQYDSANIRIDNTLPTGEIEPNSNVYLDMNAGLLWYAVMDKNKSVYIGGSMHHITQPNISYFGNKAENLKRRYTIHAGGEFPTNDQLSIMPAIMATVQNPSVNVQLGTNFRYSNHDWNEVAIRVGGWYRLVNKYVWESGGVTNQNALQESSRTTILGDAFTVTGMLEINNWLFGLSYDIHTSSIVRPTNGRNAFEISLIYIAPERIPYKTACPKF
jgi:type IX secretion system PorP/SprF family membrane protein